MRAAEHLGLQIRDVLLGVGGLQLQVPAVHAQGRLHRDPGLPDEVLNRKVAGNAMVNFRKWKASWHEDSPPPARSDAVDDSQHWKQRQQQQQQQSRTK